MLRRIASSLLLSACMAQPVAAQESCTCAGTSFAWRGCAADGGCDPAAWVGCAPSPEDDFAIGAGCHVTVDGDDVLLSHAPPQRLQVQAGGSLVVRGPARLEIGAIGLVGEPGSRVELNGCFRRFSGGGEACASTLDGDALFPAGRVIPCRDLDCGDDADLVRLDWSDANGDLAAAVDDLLARVDAQRDAICFWQRSEERFVGSDAGYCYRVRAVSTAAGERHLDFDVRQTWATQSDQAGSPLVRRDVFAATLTADAAAGERTLAFAETDLAIGRAGPAGRYLRCPNQPHAQLIAQASDAPGGDSVLLADSRGIALPIPAGTVCHLDWGWAQWDGAFVMAPVHVTPHTPAPDAAQLRLEGETSLRGVVLDGLGGNETSEAGAMLLVRNGPLAVFEHVWAVDPLVTDTAAVLLDDLPCESRVRHLSVTGGPSDPAHDKNYGLAWLGGAECTYHLEHFYARYAGDDNFVLESSGADPVGALEIRYVQAGPSSQPGDSGQLFDFGESNPTTVHVRDALCTACTSDDGLGALIVPSTGSGLVERLLWIGVRNGGLVANSDAADDGDYRFERIGVIGSSIAADDPPSPGLLTGWVADRFYVRDVRDPRPDSTRLCSATPGGVITRSLQRGVFADLVLGSTPCALGGAALADVYFVDVTHAGAGSTPLLLIPDGADDVTLSRVTVAYSRLPLGISVGVFPTSPAPVPRLALDGLLVSGLRGAGPHRAMSLHTPEAASAATWGAPTCFYDNEDDEDPAVLAAYGTPAVRGIDPGFVDPARGRFDLGTRSPLRPIGCGAGEAGYVELDWAHRKAKLVPIFMGARPTGCGLGAEIALALAALARLSRGSRAA